MSDSQRKAIFIVNPNSGKKNSAQIIECINSSFPKNVICEIALWTNIDQFNEIAQKIRSGNYTDAIAVGGDGSVSLVAKTILGTNIVLGIIPAGSGNGLARSLGISVDPLAAIKQIAEGKTAFIDHGILNDMPFFCTSGIGFDAHIGNLFANLPKRGLKSYIKLIAKEFFSYSPKEYTLTIGGKEYKRKAFLITIANAGQYGNDFYIAPEAKLNDGLFHVVVFKPFSLASFPSLIYKMVRRKAHKSRFIETFTCDSLRIQCENKTAVHFDGEPDTLEPELNFKLMPQALKVVIGKGFNGI